MLRSRKAVVPIKVRDDYLLIKGDYLLLFLFNKALWKNIIINLVSIQRTIFHLRLFSCSLISICIMTFGFPYRWPLSVSALLTQQYHQDDGRQCGQQLSVTMAICQQHKGVSFIICLGLLCVLWKHVLYADDNDQSFIHSYNENEYKVLRYNKGLFSVHSPWWIYFRSMIGLL